MAFTWLAYVDASRRNSLMKMLSKSLELSIYTKDSISVRFPTLNFFDTQSILTLLEARKVVLEIGNRFQIRIVIFMSYFLAIMIGTLCFIFAVESELIASDITESSTFIPLIVHTIFCAVCCLATLLPLSFINKQTHY